jgi:hypothetical protein
MIGSDTIDFVRSCKPKSMLALEHVRLQRCWTPTVELLRGLLAGGKTSPKTVG